MLHVVLRDERAGWRRDLGSLPTHDHDPDSVFNLGLVTALLRGCEFPVRYGHLLDIGVDAGPTEARLTDSLVYYPLTQRP